MGMEDAVDTLCSSKSKQEGKAKTIHTEGHDQKCFILLLLHLLRLPVESRLISSLCLKLSFNMRKIQHLISSFLNSFNSHTSLA